MLNRKFNALPGFRLTLGMTLFYLSLIVLIPMAALFLRVFEAATASATFAAKDFEDLPAFVTVVKEHQQPAAVLIWERLPEALRQRLATADPNDPGVQQALRNALNSVVAGSTLYDPTRFPEDELGRRSRWYVEHNRRSVWLNRSLIEDSFPGEIKKKHNALSLWIAVSTDRALAAYKLTFGASLIAALVNAIFGTILAWVLVRYQFPGKRFIDALVDFPFALPTAVAGLTLADLFSPNGWLGQFLVPHGIHGAFTPLGVIIALTFVGMPFAVRTLQPVLEHLDRSMEEAAATLGAGRSRTFLFVIGPMLAPTITTGFALSFARAVGEYGSIVFISGNKAFQTEIAPQLIVFRLEENDYLGATAIAAVLLVISFFILIGINFLEGWASRFTK